MSVFDIRNDVGERRINLRIRLTPNARQQSIGGHFCDVNGADWLKASVRSVPENGKANAECIKMLASKLGVAKSGIELISGATSRNKTFALVADESILQKVKELASRPDGQTTV